MTNDRMRPLHLAISTSICALILALAACTAPTTGGPGPGPDLPDARPPSLCNNDGTCGAGETLQNCPTDCHCGDGTCQAGETTQSCPQDCTPQAVCGDGTCQASETTTSCAQDCTASLLVQNFSSYAITGLFVRTCDNPTWSSDQLHGYIIYTNSHFTLTSIPPGCWYFKATAGSEYWQTPSGQTLIAGKQFTWNLYN